MYKKSPAFDQIQNKRVIVKLTPTTPHTIT